MAGVSTATVSRALSNPDTVAESTREAVLEAARKIGYRVNLAARNLRRQRTGAVVVLVPNLGNPFFSTILASIETTMVKAGFSVLVVDTKLQDVKEKMVFEYLHISRADGIISLDGSIPGDLLKNSEAMGVSPPIVFACEWHEDDAYPSIRVDNFAGAQLAISHLAELGHRKIGQICGPEDNVLTVARRRGVFDELKSRGLEQNENWNFPGDFSLDSGVSAARKWMELSNRPTAVFCASDEAAFGFISELHQNDINVPKDVSVIGFDDIDISRRFIPPLTSIRQPRVALGVTAANLMLKRISGDDSLGAPNHSNLPVELIIRDSTAPVCETVT